MIVNNRDDRLLRFDAETGGFLGTFGTQAGLNPGGSVFGPDGDYYVGARTRGAIARFDGRAGTFLGDFVPGGQVAFPRGFAFAPDGTFLFADGADPTSGAGGGTVLRFDARGSLLDASFISDPALSPLDLIIGADGGILISSEFPFAAANSFGSVRRYDPTTGALLSVFDAGLDPAGRPLLSRPRGIAVGPDGDLYVSSTGTGSVVRFDSATGAFLGTFAAFPGLNGQAIAFSAVRGDEGRSFLGTVTVRTDALGRASFSLTTPTPAAVGGLVTAAATDDRGNTSEFSPAVSVR